MKSLHLSAILFITTIFSNAVFAQRTVSAKLNGISGIEPEELIITRDKSSIIFSSDPNSGGFGGIYITKINRHGGYLWTKTYSISNYKDRISASAPTYDNGFIFVATTYPALGQADGVLLIKCDSVGTIEWKKKIKSKTVESMFSGVIAQTKDTGYYFSTLGENLFLFKLNSRGDIEWNKVFSKPQYGDYGITTQNIAEAPGGGAILAINEIGCEGYCDWNYLFRFDKYGNSISGVEINIPGTESPRLRTMVSDHKTVHFLYTMYGYWSGTKYYCYMNFDPATGRSKANLIPYDIFSLKTYFEKNSIFAFNDISLPVSYNYTYYTIRNSGQIIEIEGTYANVINYYQYDKKGRICPDYALPAITDTSTARHITIYPLQLNISNEGFGKEDVDVSVNTINDFTEICSGEAIDKAITTVLLSNLKTGIEQHFVINVSPNPAINYALIQIQADKNANAEVSIIGLDGRLVFKEKVTVFKGLNTKTINVSSLAKGMYILKVSDGEMIKTIKLLKS